MVAVLGPYEALPYYIHVYIARNKESGSYECLWFADFCEQNIENIVLKVKINMKDKYIDYTHI
jgi:hypothetical protein